MCVWGGGPAPTLHENMLAQLQCRMVGATAMRTRQVPIATGDVLDVDRLNLLGGFVVEAAVRELAHQCRLAAHMHELRRRTQARM